MGIGYSEDLIEYDVPKLYGYKPHLTLKVLQG